MSAALLIHRPPTPPQPADKSLGNRLQSSAAPLHAPKTRKLGFCTHKEYRTTARPAATITTRSVIKHKHRASNISHPRDWFWGISWVPDHGQTFHFQWFSTLALSKWGAFVSSWQDQSSKFKVSQRNSICKSGATIFYVQECFTSHETTTFSWNNTTCLSSGKTYCCHALKLLFFFIYIYRCFQGGVQVSVLQSVSTWRPTAARRLPGNKGLLQLHRKLGLSEHVQDGDRQPGLPRLVLPGAHRRSRAPPSPVRV